MRPAIDPYAELATIIARSAVDEAEGRTAIAGLYFGKGSSPTQGIHTTQWPCLALVIQGEKSVMLGDETLRYGVGDYLIVSLDLPVVSRVTKATPTRPYLGLGLAINLDHLKELLGAASASGLPSATSPMLGIAVNAAGPDLIEPLLRLLRLLDTPQDIPILAPLIEREILYRLLQGPAGARLVSIAMTDLPGNRVARAISWLKENYRKALRIEHLAKQVGMSVSSLHHHFKAITAMTPLQYQKQLRLHEARRLMVLERLDVGSAGFAVGYHSPSQFSREYSRHYGISPSRDIAYVGQSSPSR